MELVYLEKFLLIWYIYNYCPWPFDGIFKYVFRYAATFLFVYSFFNATPIWPYLLHIQVCEYPPFATNPDPYQVSRNPMIFTRGYESEATTE